VFDRAALLAGDEAAGPAIVEEASATTVVGRGQALRVDELGNLLLTAPGTRP
jgi:N-methylhydantoinase A/oxoprolinase/acetone carboxylase beta subunit